MTSMPYFSYYIFYLLLLIGVPENKPVVNAGFLESNGLKYAL